MSDMRAAFVQFSFKFNMLYCTKSVQLVRLYSTKQGTKLKNHYDTLKITPHATLNEVKSAYYKLTLQYHPDKNKDEYAKQKFQDISEAYEVLSNHEQRNIYDRSMLLRRQPTMSTTAEESMPHYRTKVYSGSSKIYNFDAWTEAHYGEQIRAERVRRKKYEYNKSTREVPEKNNWFMEISMFLFTMMLIAIFFSEKTDVPAFEKNRKESKDTGN